MDLGGSYTKRDSDNTNNAITRSWTQTYQFDHLYETGPFSKPRYWLKYWCYRVIVLTPSAIGYSTLPLELDRSSFELQRCRLRDHIAQSRLQKDPQPRQIGAMNVMAAAIGLQESIPGDSLAPIRGGSGPAEAAVAPAAGAKGACYCGEVHTSRPRITPTSEHTRLVEV